MAKKNKTRKTNRRKKSKNIFTSVKRFVWGVSGVIACCAALLALFNCYFPIDKNRGSATNAVTAEAGNPQLVVERQEQIINHEGFVLSYNKDYRIANWVAYELTGDEAKSREVPRSNNFIPDPKVKGAYATGEDYRRSGYDRGHLVPAGDMRWSHEAMQASFYYSNICPQDRNCNSGIWNDIENQCRTWAKRYGAVHIVTGPVITPDMKRIGGNRVGVPNMFYKVVCTIGEKGAKGIGFLVENRNYTDRTPVKVAVPIDSVEKVTGIQFFPIVAPEAQQELKSTIDLKYWKFSKR